jgi:hypothetical protein
MSEQASYTERSGSWFMLILIAPFGAIPIFFALFDPFGKMDEILPRLAILGFGLFMAVFAWFTRPQKCVYLCDGHSVHIPMKALKQPIEGESMLSIAGADLVSAERTRQDDPLDKDLFSTVLTIRFRYQGTDHECSLSHTNGNAGGGDFLKFADAVAALIEQSTQSAN